MKKVILGLIIGVLITGAIEVVAYSLISANSVMYQKGDTVTTVDATLTELLEKASNSSRVKVGMINTLVSTYKYEVELGFKPVYVEVVVYRSGVVRSINVYDERLGTLINKIGSDTNNTVGLPVSTSDAIYDTGFRLNQGYGYDGWYLYYVAFDQFPQ